MIRRSMALLCSTAIILVGALLTSGCIDNNERVADTISIIQITGISAVATNGVVTEVTFELHVNGTLEIELGSLEMRMEVPPSFGQAGSDISFGYNGSDPWSGDGKNYSVVEPAQDTSDHIPLIIMGGDHLVLRLNLSTAGVELQTASILPFEITWNNDGASRFNLYMPSLIPTDGTFRITYTVL